MRHFLLLLSFWAAACCAQEIIPPFNPDANQDSAIGAPDLLEMLPLFGGYFTPAPVMIDGVTAEAYIAQLQAALDSAESDSIAVPFIEGNVPGDMLIWDGSAWSLLPSGIPGDVLQIGTNGLAWRNLVDALEVEGCTDPHSCNFNPIATIEDGSCFIEIFDNALLKGNQNTGVVKFEADGSAIDTIYISVGFNGGYTTFTGSSEPFVLASELTLTITDPAGNTFNMGANSGYPWPSWWDSKIIRTYQAFVDLSTTNLSGAGEWSFTMGSTTSYNKFSSYSLKIRGLDGFNCEAAPPFLVPPPTNDNCTDAVLVAEGTHAFNNMGTNTDGPTDGNYNMSNDVWFLYTPSADGTATIHTCNSPGSLDDTVLIVYDGSSCPSAGDEVLAMNDDGCSNPIYNSTLDIEVSASNTYLIQLGGWNGAQGTGELYISLQQ